MNYSISLQSVELKRMNMHLTYSGWCQATGSITHPKVILHFQERNSSRDRRIPLVLHSMEYHDGKCFFEGSYDYYLNHIFYRYSDWKNPVDLYVNVLLEDGYQEKVPYQVSALPEAKSRASYGCSWEKDHLVLARTKQPISKPLMERGCPGLLVSWLLFAICWLLWPLTLVPAGLALKGILPYQSRHAITAKKISRRLFRQMNHLIFLISGHEINFKKMKMVQLNYYFRKERKKPLSSNVISFVSVRRNDLSGNMEYVYPFLKTYEGLEIRTFLCAKELQQMNREEIRQVARICAGSKVIVVDEYTYFIHQLDLRPETRVVQLWHACGAFKTFGYTRLGKNGGTLQNSTTHKNYDYVTVSSESVRIWYAEGFGVPTDRIFATGIARTDVFFDEGYREKTKQQLHDRYPVLKDKKVILFAPTFRGETRLKAYYPMERFDVAHFMSHIPNDYILIIKHHPFVREMHPIPEQYQDRVIDLSAGSELNDLLMIADLIITDYSSLVFEASLLDIPMLFYTYDLEEYLEERDFYFNFESFIPGKHFENLEDLEQAVRDANYGAEKIPGFREQFCGSLDGHASERIAEMIYAATKQ